MGIDFTTLVMVCKTSIVTTASHQRQRHIFLETKFNSIFFSTHFNKNSHINDLVRNIVNIFCAKYLKKLTLFKIIKLQ